MIKLIVAGTRTFKDYGLLKVELDKIRAAGYEFEIVSGTAQGADKLGEQYAIEHNLPIKRFPANWEKYGKSAGYKRNAEMAEYGNCCMVFWDGKSPGSSHMIDIAKSKGLLVKVVRY